MRNFRKYTEYYDQSSNLYRVHKILPTGTITNGRFFDVSCTGPYPTSQYYASEPLAAKALYGKANKGVYVGENVSPKKKYLHSITTWNSINGPTLAIMADVLMFYPFIDLSLNTEQVMTNSVSLPRYTTGEGVMMVALSQGSPSAAQNMQVKYTNSDGVEGRITPTIRTFNGATPATGISLTSTFAIAASNTNYFYLGLQDGDRGVRKVESVTFDVENTGLMVIALIKPLATIITTALNQVTEKVFAKDSGIIVPVIEDDAYLTFFTQAGSGTLGGTIHYYFLDVFVGD